MRLSVVAVVVAAIVACTSSSGAAQDPLRTRLTPPAGFSINAFARVGAARFMTVGPAAVMRFDADGRNGRVFSSGLGNAVGIAMHPVTKEIWVTQNERDDIAPDHEDMPPEEIDILRDGADYGWPFGYGDRVPSPDREFHEPARCGRTVAPALPMQSHSAPLGITFLDRATMFPTDWRGDAVVAFHGSWNRAVPTGPKVVPVRIRDARLVSYEDFITGWQGPNGRRWGRPVDVMVYSDGSLLISDDAAGAIYRVSRAGDR